MKLVSNVVLLYYADIEDEQKVLNITHNRAFIFMAMNRVCPDLI